MKIFLGIDFGTTQTVVTMIKEGSTYEPEVVEIDGKKTVDTVLCIDAEDNVVFFGSDALDRIHDAPEDTFYNFKVTIGSGKIFRSSHKDYRPETLALLFLKHLRQKIEKNYFNVADLAEQEDLYCTVGCPAAWNERQRQAVINLAQKAGFPNVSCCDEPLSVIYYYHSRREISLTKPQNILVYDFGGGTTDVAIEEISPDANGFPCKNPRVLAVSGMSNLGGRDFDERLRDHFIREMDTDATKLGGKDLKTLERYSRLIKETLSISVDRGANSVKKTIPMLFSKRSSHSLALSKEKFEQICGSFIEQLEEPVYDVLHIAALDASQIDDVIITGGSSQLYYVKSKIKALFPEPSIVINASNPVEVIAKGLALYARAFAAGISMPEPAPQQAKPAEDASGDVASVTSEDVAATVASSTVATVASTVASVASAAAAVTSASAASVASAASAAASASVAAAADAADAAGKLLSRGMGYFYKSKSGEAPGTVVPGDHRQTADTTTVSPNTTALQDSAQTAESKDAETQ